MIRKNRYTASVAVAAMLCLLLSSAYGQAGKDAKKKEFTFHGKIEKIDATKQTLTVNSADVPGWMSSMTMDYGVDKPDVIKNLKVGDQITAKVYEDDFKVLYDVKVEPPPAAKDADKGKGKK